MFKNQTNRGIGLDIFGELLSPARIYVNNTPIHACLYVPSWLGLLTYMHCTVSTPEIVWHQLTARSVPLRLSKRDVLLRLVMIIRSGRRVCTARGHVCDTVTPTARMSACESWSDRPAGVRPSVPVIPTSQTSVWTPRDASQKQTNFQDVSVLTSLGVNYYTSRLCRFDFNN